VRRQFVGPDRRVAGASRATIACAARRHLVGLRRRAAPASAVSLAQRRLVRARRGGGRPSATIARRRLTRAIRLGRGTGTRGRTFVRFGAGIAALVAGVGVRVDPVGGGVPGLRGLAVLPGAGGLLPGLCLLALGPRGALGGLRLTPLRARRVYLRVVPVLGGLPALLLEPTLPTPHGQERRRGEHDQNDDDDERNVHS
jgi:hypothetical protein